MQGIELLLANCDKLTTLQDLKYFEGISPDEHEKLESRIQETNLDIKLVENDNYCIEFQEQNFMNIKLKDKYPPFDNSIEWETGWSGATTAAC